MLTVTSRLSNVPAVLVISTGIVKSRVVVPSVMIRFRSDRQTSYQCRR